MSVHNLYIDIDRSEAVRSSVDSSVVSLPQFVQGDSLQLRIWLLSNYSQLEAYDEVPVSGITLQVALGTKVGNSSTLYTQQYTWTPSADLGQPYLSATLPMSTAEITTLLGSSATASAWFEVKMISSAVPVTILSKQVTIQAAVIKSDSTSVPAPLTPLSAEAANASYVRTIHTGSFDLYNANGKGCRIYVDEDGAFRADPLS
jgi:hypothetical protein